MEVNTTDAHYAHITFVQATEQDIDSIRNLAHEIWQKHYTPIIGKDQVDYMLELMYAPETIKKDMADGLKYYLIQYKEDNAGYIGIKTQQNKIFLSRIYIMEEFRGKKLGRAAISYITSLAAAHNCFEIYLTVNRDNATSIKFYQDNGFKITSETQKDIGNGYIMDDYIMTKSFT